jgi:hypothetical protein
MRRTPEALASLAAFVAEVRGKSYSLSVTKLAFTSNRSKTEAQLRDAEEAYFCSQLVAHALGVLGALPNVLDTKGRSTAYYWYVELNELPRNWFVGFFLVVWSAYYIRQEEKQKSTNRVLD